MNDIITFGEGFEVNGTRVESRKKTVDIIQILVESFIRTPKEGPLFLWLCLVLFLNRKHWKRPVIVILILYWFLQSLGQLTQNLVMLVDEEKTKHYLWPFTKLGWYIGNGLAHTIWLTSEIIADWYPLLRTKALVKNNKKMKPIYVVCIVFNIIKVFQILTDFIFIPSSLKADLKPNSELLLYKAVWWSVVVVIQLVNLLYDIFVMIALKNNLFDKLESFKYKSNNFLDKFKQISEFRIFVSIIISIMFFPFAVIQVIYYILRNCYPQLNIVSITTEIENLRVIGLRFTYTFMYIDQILLRFYVKRNKSSYVSINSKDSLVTSPTLYTSSPSNFSPNLNTSGTSINNKRISLYRNRINEQDISNYYNDNSIYIQTSNEIKSSYYLKNLRDLKTTEE